MSLIKSYMPDYVLRLQQGQHSCCCAGCQGSLPRVQLRWKNQVRHSAVLSCDRVAREILCHDQPLYLHVDEAVAENLPEFCSELRTVNQCCLRLLAGSQNNACFSLFQLGLFLRKIDERQQGKSWLTLADELLQPNRQRQSAVEFSRSSMDEGCKLAALRALGQLHIQANTDAQHQAALSQQLHMLANVSDDCLQQQLHSLEQQNAGLQTLSPVLTNFLGYEIYHNVFPGRDVATWQSAFADLCQHFFQLKMLFALCITLDLPLDDNSISALSAGWQRARPQRVYTANPGDFGMALLK